MSSIPRPKKKDEALSIDEILRLLRDTPPQIGALTANLSTADLRRPPAPDEWSINDNLVYGALFEYTVQYYGNKLAQHEAVHIPQIEGVVRSLSS